MRSLLASAAHDARRAEAPAHAVRDGHSDGQAPPEQATTRRRRAKAAGTRQEDHDEGGVMEGRQGHGVDRTELRAWSEALGALMVALEDFRTARGEAQERRLLEAYERVRNAPDHQNHDVDT
jgi:hypothetical protein